MKTKAREEMYKKIRRHGEQLQAIFPETRRIDPVQLCKKMRRLETELHRRAVDYCNGVCDSEEWEINKEDAMNALGALLGYKVPWFINSDPRGYAIKIDDQYMRDHNLNLYRDMGGYGIIAPDLS